MTLKQLNNLCFKYNICDEVILTSDSGWECCATEMNGVYYNKKENIIVFTQEFSKHDDYYNDKDWIELR